MSVQVVGDGLGQDAAGGVLPVQEDHPCFLEFLVQFVAHAQAGVLAPLDAGLHVVVHDKTAILTLDLYVVGEDLHLVPALRALFYVRPAWARAWG